MEEPQAGVVGKYRRGSGVVCGMGLVQQNAHVRVFITNREGVSVKSISTIVNNITP
jgi:hypothetical protein